MKILVVNNNMQVGGIQKALSNLLGEISSRYDVTLFLFYPNGDLIEDIGKDVKLLKGNFFTRVMGMSQAEAANVGKITALFRGVCVILSRIFGSGCIYRLLSKLNRIKEPYDVVISFMQNSEKKTFYGGCNEFAIYSVKAKKKISFVHCDFKNYPGNNPYNISLYDKFDKIACVSDSVRSVFEDVCPKYVNKTVTSTNMHDFDFMNKSAEEYKVKKEDGKVTLFTSARISEEKGILRMMPILSDIKKSGGKFIWYIAGNGPEYDKAIEKAEEHNLKEEIIFLGLLKNPYPYFKEADLLLVPSYNEAAPMVFTEAICFKTPVFTTATTSAEEMIGERNGWVVENTDGAIFKELKELILSPEKIKGKEPDALIGNETAIKQFDEMLR